MSKDKDLYFIPIIADAFQQEDTTSALQKAFRKIEQLGRTPGHRRGFTQFCRFMAEVVSHITVSITTERDNKAIGTIKANPLEGVALLGGITPGNYVVKLSTGRVIWEGTLSQTDVLWTKAFPNEQLALAADTGAPLRRFSRKEILLNGEIVLYVFPGVECGDIGIEIKKTTLE